MFDVLILTKGGISVKIYLQVAKQLVYNLQVNLSLSNDNIYFFLSFCIIFPTLNFQEHTTRKLKGKLEELGFGTILC